MFELALSQKLEAENELHYRQEKDQSDYEQSLQKLEAEIRQHIRVINYIVYFED